MVNVYSNITIRDAQGNVIGYTPVTPQQPYVYTGYDPNSAAGIAYDVAKQGGTYDPYLGQKAYNQGFTQANQYVKPNDTGRSTVPVRDLSSQMQQPVYSDHYRQGMDTYMPVGEMNSQLIRDSKIVIGENTGEFGVYQKSYYMGQERREMALVGGGGRAALQSGMFSYEEPLTDAEHTFEQWDIGKMRPATIEYGETHSGMGAEAYGGFGNLPLDGRLLTPDSQMSTYDSPFNLARLVNPQGANMSKTQAPGVDIPWGLSPGSPQVQYVDAQGKLYGGFDLVTKPVGMSAGYVPKTPFTSVGKSALPGAPTLFDATGFTIEKASPNKPGWSSGFDPSVQTTQKPIERWETGIPVIGGFIPAGIFKPTSKITEPGYKEFVTWLAPIETTSTKDFGTQIINRSELPISRGADFKPTFFGADNKPTQKLTMPIGDPFTKEGIEYQNYQTYDLSKVNVSKSATVTTVGLSPAMQGWEDYNKVLSDKAYGGYGSLFGLSADEARKGVEISTIFATGQANASPTPTNLFAAGGAGTMKYAFDKPADAAIFAAEGFAFGAIARGAGAVYGSAVRVPLAEAAISQGGKWRSALQFSDFLTSKAIPGAMVGMYGADVSYRTTSGFTEFGAGDITSKAVPILAFETIPMSIGFGAGYKLPEGLGYAGRSLAKVPGKISDSIFSMEQKFGGVERIPKGSDWVGGGDFGFDNPVASSGYKPGSTNQLGLPDLTKSSGSFDIAVPMSGKTNMIKFNSAMGIGDTFVASKSPFGANVPMVMEEMWPAEPIDKSYGPKSPIVWQDGVAWNTAMSDFPVVSYDIQTMSTGAIPINKMQQTTRLTWMTPNELKQKQIDMFNKYDSDSTGIEIYNKRKTFNPGYSVEELKTSMMKGDVFNPLTLFYDRYGNIDASVQEGAHRTHALNELGVTKVPVWETYQRGISKRGGIYELYPEAKQVMDMMPSYDIGNKYDSPVRPTQLEALDYVRKRYPNHESIWNDYLAETQMIGRKFSGGSYGGKSWEMNKPVEPMQAPTTKTVSGARNPTKYEIDMYSKKFGKEPRTMLKMEPMGGESYRILETPGYLPEGMMMTTGKGKPVSLKALEYQAMIRPQFEGKMERTYGMPLKENPLYQSATPQQQRKMAFDEKQSMTQAEKAYRGKHGGGGATGNVFSPSNQKRSSDPGFNFAVSSGIGGGPDQMLQLKSLMTFDQLSPIKKKMRVLQEEEEYWLSPASILINTGLTVPSSDNQLTSPYGEQSLANQIIRDSRLSSEQRGRQIAATNAKQRNDILSVPMSEMGFGLIPKVASAQTVDIFRRQENVQNVFPITQPKILSKTKQDQQQVPFVISGLKSIPIQEPIIETVPDFIQTPTQGQRIIQQTGQTQRQNPFNEPTPPQPIPKIPVGGFPFLGGGGSSGAPGYGMGLDRWANTNPVADMAYLSRGMGDPFSSRKGKRRKKFRFF
jgi:hypothetical protein